MDSQGPFLFLWDDSEHFMLSLIMGVIAAVLVGGVALTIKTIPWLITTTTEVIDAELVMDFVFYFAIVIVTAFFLSVLGFVIIHSLERWLDE